jgi:hypothetical protein
MGIPFYDLSNNPHVYAEAPYNLDSEIYSRCPICWGKYVERDYERGYDVLTSEIVADHGGERLPAEADECDERVILRLRDPVTGKPLRGLYPRSRRFVVHTPAGRERFVNTPPCFFPSEHPLPPLNFPLFHSRQHGIRNQEAPRSEDL